MRTWKILAIMAMVVIVGTCCSKSSNNYIPMIVSFVDEASEDYFVDEQDSTVGRPSAETNKIIKECQLQMIKYFSSKGINITEDISKLDNVYIFEKTDWEVNLDGYYKPGTYDVYLSNHIIEDTEYLKFVYVHEVMHYLGCTDDQTTMIAEGMADAITEDILEYAYEYSYDVPRWLCHQMLIADPEMLQYIMNGGDLDNRIDDRLENVPREWHVDKHQMKMSDVLDVLLYQVEYNELDTDSYISYVIQCQYIVTAYCNTLSLNVEQVYEIEGYQIYFD